MSTNPVHVLPWSFVVYGGTLWVLQSIPSWFGVHSIYSQPFYLTSSVMLALVVSMMAWMYARDFRTLRASDPFKADLVRNRAAVVAEVLTACGLLLSCVTFVQVGRETEMLLLERQIAQVFQPLKEDLRRTLLRDCLIPGEKTRERQFCKSLSTVLDDSFIVTDPVSTV